MQGLYYAVLLSLLFFALFYAFSGLRMMEVCGILQEMPLSKRLRGRQNAPSPGCINPVP